MLARNLVAGPDATRTQVKPDRSAVNIKRGRLDVWHPSPPRMLLGVTYPVAEAQRFSANITFDSQFINLSKDSLPIMYKNDI